MTRCEECIFYYNFPGVFYHSDGSGTPPEISCDNNSIGSKIIDKYFYEEYEIPDDDEGCPGFHNNDQ